MSGYSYYLFRIFISLLCITSVAANLHSQELTLADPLLVFPTINVTKTNAPAEGNIYMTNLSYIPTAYDSYMMILDNSSRTIFKQINSSLLGSMDFRPQQNGLYTYYDEKAKKYYGLDPNFNLKDSFEVQGLTPDDHELQCFSDGSYILLGAHIDTVDMSKLVAGGNSAALVTFQTLQEFDKHKKLIFSWDTKDHYQITDAIYSGLTGKSIDVTHINSIERDSDGNFIISSRSQSEVTKINANDGSVIWRMGGRHDQFTHTDFDTFNYQHDVRRLSNGNITLFDNGNNSSSFTPYSRAVEYEIDEKAMTMKRVWQFRHSPDIFAQAMGSVQRLASGNTMIGWGFSDGTALTEVAPDGSISLEMTWDKNILNYRVYKFTDQEVANMQAHLNAVQNESHSGITLDQNYPNPISSSSMIRFSTSEYGQVHLEVFDALGREVKILFDGSIPPGNYSVKFEAENLSDGVYFYRLITPKASLSRMMNLVK
jgi:hypothetical protein